ncbi:MAG TPA: hypothetical protein VGN17_11595 [Bryobacteraceae bacterium]|jgi:hypothetical protein
MNSSIVNTTFSFIAAAGVLLAQQAPSQGGWQRVGEGGTARTTAPAPAPNSDSAPPPVNEAPVPAQLTLKPGTFISVRMSQGLSSDRSQQGDAFTATLDRPLVVDGIIVAQRGQTVAGRVSEAQKAGRIKGVSHLGVQLTDLTIADGQQVPINSALVTRAGRTSEGRDAGAIAGTTGVGAIAGAAAGGGAGAGIGAGAGAAAGIIGVLLTRGQPTIIYPEQLLTFRIDSPVVVSTERAPQAFVPVQPGDYNQPSPRPQLRRAATPPPPAYYGYGSPYPYWGPSYYGYGYPGFYGGIVIRGGGRFRR